MNRFVGFLLAVFSVFVLTSCGGGGGGAVQNPVVFTQTVTLAPAGGVIEDATRGIKLTVPAGALTQATDVTLEVRQSQRSGVTPNGWTTNANAIDASVDPNAVAETGEIEVRIPFDALDPDERALFLSTDDQGLVVPLEAEYDTNGFTGTVTKDVLEDAGRSRSRGAGQTVGLFLQITSVVVSQPSGGLWVYEGGTFRQPLAGETMDQECTAVLVHGINDTRQDLLPLAQFLSRGDIAPGDQPAYDEIWVYQYNWLAGIDGSGADFANDVKAVAGTGEIDVWGHSMGGLVARWAIEKESLGDEVGRLYTLGTPHEGFPFSVISRFIAYILGVPLTDGLEDLFVDSEFLQELNTGDSPYMGTAKYFTLCGDEWHGQFLGIGFYYNWLGIDSDSVVPVFSARSSVLVQKSSYWANNILAAATIELNHSALRSTGQTVSQLVQNVLTDDARGWLEACEHGGGITVSISPSFVNLEPSGTQQFTATVEGTANQGVTWTVDEPGGGTVTSGGLYTAPANVGTYHVRATSQADPSTSSTSDVFVQSGGEWTVVNLHPPGEASSYAHGVADGKQVGHVGGDWDSGGRACLWNGTAGSVISLHPTGASESSARDVSSDQQVGWMHDGFIRASLWSGSATSWVNLTPAGSGSHWKALGCGDGQQVGHSGLAPTGAALWSGSAGTYVNLHPGVATSSLATETSQGFQVGMAYINGFHASLWQGSSSSWIDLHPAGATSSYGHGIHGNLQVGWVQLSSGGRHASLWQGTPESWQDIHPTVASSSTAFAVHTGMQVGVATVGSQSRASFWSGTAASWVDLHAILSASFLYSFAFDVWYDGATTYVVGYGGNSATGRNEALMWVKSN